jgi:hypothetical protein
MRAIGAISTLDDDANIRSYGLPHRNLDDGRGAGRRLHARLLVVRLDRRRRNPRRSRGRRRDARARRAAAVAIQARDGEAVGAGWPVGGVGPMGGIEREWKAYRVAVERGDVRGAMRTAKMFDLILDLGDTLSLVFLAARERDPIYDRMAVRWIRRLDDQVKNAAQACGGPVAGRAVRGREARRRSGGQGHRKIPSGGVGASCWELAAAGVPPRAGPPALPPPCRYERRQPSLPLRLRREVPA